MALPHILAVLVVLLCSLYQVHAHAWMSNPLPRGQYTNPKKRADQEYQPTAGFDPYSPDIVCRSDPAMPVNAMPVYTAGQKVDVTLSFNAVHPGDCFFYLTYDGDKPDTEKKWFKIFEQHDCYAHPQVSLTIPSYLPSAAHAVLRWEWYALHLMDMGTGHVEYFASCTDVVIMGFPGGQLPSPQVNIPGHLPLLNTNNYWDPYNGAPQFFTGPPVASLGAGVPTPPSIPTTKPPSGSTTKPTVAPIPATPAPTQSPTQAPTQAPTAKPTPAATQAPTRRPGQNTPRPTSAPATQPPTQPPAATRPPTQPPAATQAPTQPPAPTLAPPMSVTCSDAETGHMRCVGDSTYQTCSHGLWSVLQSCGTGLVCSEERPPYIYCVVPPLCDE